jgi:LysR substrate binding domain.
LHYEKFLDDELVGVVSTKWKFNKEEINLEELMKMPLVMREQGSGTLDMIKKELACHNIKLSDMNIVMYMGSTESIKLFLDNSHTMGIVSIKSISKDLISNRFRIVDIQGLNMNRQFMWVQRQGQESKLPEIFKAFVSRNNKLL